jgi:hypothetical protein
MIEIEGIESVVSKVDPGHSLLIIQLLSGFTNNFEWQNKIKNHVGTIKDEYIYFVSEEKDGLRNEITFDVYGKDIYELEEIVIRLSKDSKSLKGVNESVLRFKPSREEMQLLLDSYIFALSEIKFSDFSDQLRLAIQGGIASKFIMDDREMDIRVRYASEFRDSVDNLENIRIKNALEQFVPIIEVVNQRVNKVPLKIYHKDKDRNLSFTVKMNGQTSSVIGDVIKIIKNSELPEGYRIELQERIKSRSKWMHMLLFGLVIFCNFAALLLLFESIPKAIKLSRLIIYPSLLYFIAMPVLMEEAIDDHKIIGWVIGTYFSLFSYIFGLTRSNYLSISLVGVCIGCGFFINNDIVGFYHMVLGISIFYLLFLLVSTRSTSSAQGIHLTKERRSHK